MNPRLPLSLTPDAAVELACAVWHGEWFVQTDNTYAPELAYRHRFTLWNYGWGTHDRFTSL